MVTIADEQAMFTATLIQLCKNSSTSFTATSIQSNSAIVNYEWDFDDGTGPISGNNVSHVFVNAQHPLRSTCRRFE